LRHQVKIALLAFALCACVSGTALAVGWMIRSTPVVLVPKAGDTLWYVGCRSDSLGVPRQVFLQVTLDP
jgi:hypothetical protein